ncbi:hypothetical protein SXCC_00655 [Gluconacetobacter sp. SXCC-1]|nr:hypothetical protein SXCC_00655 [Gluconacetobacter sp. SXCC-1]
MLFFQLHQNCRTNFQNTGETKDYQKRRIPHASFHPTDIRSIQFSTVCKFLLAYAETDPFSVYDASKHHTGIFTRPRSDFQRGSSWSAGRPGPS